ncbi:hypothetical protein D9599_01075 [Roseomonas sp. KE2513]|uniref:hypothetical protein n=1 Tax=Roseomonas sp. KE2513 TaxID=2479202 RepID=UPI0018DFEF5B|nr:hypothetical protein [Roseomonas sp. KE2513]MBI0534166.1 hypothetical protein [Roseomonas sp. KE2513]
MLTLLPRIAMCTALVISLSGCGGANGIAMRGNPSARELVERRERETRTYAHNEAAVLTAAGQVAQEDGCQIVVEEQAIGVVGGLNRREMSDGQMAGQVAAGIALAVLLGPASAGPVVARTDRRYTIVSTPLPGGGTRLRLTVEGREQHTSGSELVMISGTNSAYSSFFDRVAARLAAQPALNGGRT